jgi:hypothetical protein
VEAGKRANLILRRKHPTQNLQAYDEIVKVVIRGKVIDRGLLPYARRGSRSGEGQTPGPENPRLVRSVSGCTLKGTPRAKIDAAVVLLIANRGIYSKALK